MQTHFSSDQLALAKFQTAEDIIRKCVHCGMCTATCPTFKVLGDELDSPRGRIYQIQNLLEDDRSATKAEMLHLDRCLSCLSCETTCPSGVEYGHLIDLAREHIQKKNRRPLFSGMLRKILLWTLPYPTRTRLAMRAAGLTKPLKVLFKPFSIAGQVNAMMDLLPDKPLRKSPAYKPHTCEAVGKRKGRVILVRGCVQSVISPDINEAAISLLTFQGVEVIVAKDHCCGALSQHMGLPEKTIKFAKHNIETWHSLITHQKVDAIISTTSGCGTLLQNYDELFEADDPLLEKATLVREKYQDINSYLMSLDLPEVQSMHIGQIAFQSPCSLQHGQKILNEPITLLTKAGFKTLPIPEQHICCGSAGIYNIMQPDLANELRDRKLKNIDKIKPQPVIIATANIGCKTHLQKKTDTPVLHIVQLLAWSYCGILPTDLVNVETT